MIKNDDIFINSILEEIDTTILSIMSNNYDNTFNQFQLHSLKPSYTMDSIQDMNSSVPLSLTEYLFLKSKSYALEYLLTLTLILKDSLKAKDDVLPIKDLITPITFILNDEILDNKESLDKNLKSTGLYKKNDQLITKVKYVIESFKHMNFSNIMDTSSPYLFFKSIYNYHFDIDFFYKDIVFCTAFFQNQNKDLLQKDNIDYIALLTHLMYRNTKGNITASNNVIKLSNTILAYIEKEEKFSEYKKIEMLIEKMNTDLELINKIYQILDSSNNRSRYYSFHHLINTYYHNQFFNSIYHPLVKILIREIDFKELFDVIIKDNSSYSNTNNEWTNVSESKTVLEHYSLKESAYYLRLLGLLMKFNIDFYQITFEDLYCLKTKEEEIFKKFNYNDFEFFSCGKMTTFKSDRYHFLKEQKFIFDITIHFIYDYLEEFENIIFDLSSELFKTIELASQNELTNQNSCHLLNGLIGRITLQLDEIYKFIPDELEFSKIDTEENYDQYYHLFRKYPFLLAYLIKQGFTKG